MNKSPESVEEAVRFLRIKITDKGLRALNTLSIIIDNLIKDKSYLDAPGDLYFGASTDRLRSLGIDSMMLSLLVDDQIMRARHGDYSSPDVGQVNR